MCSVPKTKTVSAFRYGFSSSYRFLSLLGDSRNVDFRRFVPKPGSLALFRYYSKFLENSSRPVSVPKTKTVSAFRYGFTASHRFLSLLGDSRNVDFRRFVPKPDSPPLFRYYSKLLKNSSRLVSVPKGEIGSTFRYVFMISGDSIGVSFRLHRHMLQRPVLCLCCRGTLYPPSPRALSLICL